MVSSEMSGLRETLATENEARKAEVADLEDRMGEIFKGLCDNVKGEMDSNRKELEDALAEETKIRMSGEEDILEKVALAKKQVVDTMDEVI